MLLPICDAVVVVVEALLSVPEEVAAVLLEAVVAVVACAELLELVAAADGVALLCAVVAVVAAPLTPVALMADAVGVAVADGLVVPVVVLFCNVEVDLVAAAAAVSVREVSVAIPRSLAVVTTPLVLVGSAVDVSVLLEHPLKTTRLIRSITTTLVHAIPFFIWVPPGFAFSVSGWVHRSPLTKLIWTMAGSS